MLAARRSLDSQTPTGGRARCFAMAAALALLSLGSGCYVRTSYLIAPDQEQALAALPPEELRQATVPLRRASDQRPVVVRADSARAALPSRGQLIHTRRYSPMVTSAVALVALGSALSVAGTIMFLSTEGDLRLIGGLIALSGEPPMITGTVLWPLGITRPPQEVRP